MLLLIIGQDNPVAAPILNAYRAYSIAILSFLGGIRWGQAIGREQNGTDGNWISLIGSVIPSLLAWSTVFMPPLGAIAVLLLGFCAQGAWDAWSAQAGKLPAWFSPLRITLTLVVAASHAGMFLLIASN